MLQTTFDLSLIWIWHFKFDLVWFEQLFSTFDNIWIWSKKFEFDFKLWEESFKSNQIKFQMSNSNQTQIKRHLKHSLGSTHPYFKPKTHQKCNQKLSDFDKIYCVFALKCAYKKYQFSSKSGHFLALFWPWIANQDKCHPKFLIFFFTHWNMKMGWFWKKICDYNHAVDFTLYTEI